MLVNSVVTRDSLYITLCSFFPLCYCLGYCCFGGLLFIVWRWCDLVVYWFALILVGFWFVLV